MWIIQTILRRWRVISSYEINDIVQLIQEVDENVIINVFKTEDFYGGFYRESLD